MWGRSEFAAAEVKVAFFELYDLRGNRVELEKGSRFAHVAISYGKGWIHAHPQRGVVYDLKLESIAPHYTIISNPSIPALTYAQVRRFLGLPYDSTFTWSDPFSTYCSKLIAQLLDIPPQPMDFSASHWGPQYKKYHGLPGISPDKVYRSLLQRNYNQSAKRAQCFSTSEHT